jgi:hypothetical protein
MSSTLRKIVTIQPGGRVEIPETNLPEGQQVEVTVRPIVSRQPDGRNWRDLAGSFNSDDATAGENDKIDADLARESINRR